MENNVSVTQEQQEQPVVCLIHKMTFSEGRAYRYHISDRDGNPLYMAEPTGLLLPSPTRLVEFFDPEHQPTARLEPPETAPWLRATRYDLFVGGAEEPQAVIREQWRLVDILLLRLPRYTIQLDTHYYIAKGRRYGEHLYEIFPMHEEPREKAEQIESPSYPMNESIGVKQAFSPPHTPGEGIEAGATEETPENTGWSASEEKDGAMAGYILRPVAGPSYVIVSDVAPLCQAILVLAALTILIDMEAYG